MTRFAVRGFGLEDMEGFEPRADQHDEWHAFRLMAHRLWHGPDTVWTFLHSNRPIGFGGLQRVPGRLHIAEAWSVMGKVPHTGYGRMIAFARHALPALARVHGFSRIETRARCDIAGAGAALERIGFVVEGLHRRAGAHGGDEMSYALLVEI